MTHNPLIEKFYELHPEKKEKPKKVEQKKVGYELPEEFLNLYGNPPSTISVTTPSVATSNTGITKANPIPKLTSYDPHSTEHSFLQVAELIKQKKGKIISMSMSVDATKLFAKTISFEVMVADWDTP